MPTPEELQAEVDRLKQELADNRKKVDTAASIQRAFTSLRDKKPEAAQYLEDVAAGRVATPFWKDTEATPPPDPDIDAEGALKAMEQRLTEQFQAQLNQMTNLLSQQAQAANTRAMNLESRNAIAQAESWFKQTYPALDWEKYRAIAGSMPGADQLAGSQEGLQTLLNAAVAPDLIEHGRSQIAEEKARVNEAVNSIFGGPTPTGARGSDEDDFADLDDEFTSNPEGALQKAVERMSAHL